MNLTRFNSLDVHLQQDLPYFCVHKSKISVFRTENIEKYCAIEPC